MGMTISRWAVTVGIICAAVAATLLPFPSALSLGGVTVPSAPLAAETARLTQAAAATQRAVRSYRVALGLARWTSTRTGADTAFIRLDASVSAETAAAVRAIVAEQWAALGPRASARHAEVFVYVDTTSIPRASNAGAKPRSLEGRALVDVAFAPPEATGGERCVTLVRLRGSTSAHIAALRTQSLLGVCGFFAAFGRPGDGIRGWLAMTGYRFAQRSDWGVARAPAIDATALYSLSEAGGRCLTGRAGACVDALLINDSARHSERAPLRAPERVIDASSPTYTTVGNVRTAVLGGAEGQLLADAVRSVGPEQFARFWTSSSRPDAAYLASTGLGLDSWTRQWLTRTYGAVGDPPTVRLLDVMWLVGLAPVILIIAARPRERVLAEAR